LKKQNPYNEHLNKLQLDMDLREIIRQHYVNFLNREPDPEGLEYYFTEIKNHRIKISDLEIIFKNSNEYKSTIFQKEIIFNSKFSKKEIKNFFKKENTFYHTMNINGIETKNTRTSSQYQAWISQVIPKDLTGKSVLDVGCSDGFYSFLCEQRNANRILAIDYESFEMQKEFPESEQKKNPNNLELYKKLINSHVEYMNLGLHDIDLIKETFDFVLFFGIYYHIQDLVSSLKKIYSIVNDSVFLAGHILESEHPIMYYYDTSNEDDLSNRFAPIVASPQCLINIANVCGFEKAELVDTISQTLGRTYPHIFSNSDHGKIGLFKFSKKTS